MSSTGSFLVDHDSKKKIHDDKLYFQQFGIMPPRDTVW